MLIWGRLASLVGGSGGSKLFRLGFGYCIPERVDVGVTNDWYGADLGLYAALSSCPLSAKDRLKPDIVARWTMYINISF